MMDELWEAVAENDVEKVMYLLSQGKVNPNKRYKSHFTNPRQATPLLLACDKQYYEIVEMLLMNKRYPADVNMSDSQGLRPIWIAVEKNDFELARLLLATAKVDFEFVKNLDDEPIALLIMAVRLGNQNMVQDLLEGGADINCQKLIQQNYISWTPLMEAVRRENIAMCRFLLDAGCDINFKVRCAFTRKFQTAIMLSLNRKCESRPRRFNQNICARPRKRPRLRASGPQLTYGPGTRIAYGPEARNLHTGPVPV